MDEHHRGACALVTLTFAFSLVGCAAGPGQSATPTTSTPAPTATGTPSAPASPEPTILPTATPATGDVGVTWRAVTGVPPLMGGMTTAVTAGGPGWVAAASTTDGSAPTAWTSVDGATWQQGARLPLPAGGAGDTMVAMASLGTEIVGVGGTGAGGGAIVWRSKDGGAWEVIGSGALFDLGPCPAGCASVSSIAAGPSGIAVAGYRVKPVGSRYELETDLWSTQDGVAWVRVAAPVPAGSSDKPAAEITVAAVDQGFIAAGSMCDKTGTVCRSVTWASSDGRTWAAPVNLPDGKGVGAQRLVVGPAGAVILGMRCPEGGCRLVAWSSTDGVSWASADLAGAYVEGSTELAAAGGTFVLVTSTDGAKVAAWTSTDGHHWAPKTVRPGLDPAAPLGQILELAGRPGGLLAMGLVSGQESGTAFWVSP